MIDSKAQASMEYLINYVWAFLTLIIFIGVLAYFNLFNAERYASQYCNFDSNFYCHNFIIGEDNNQFSMRLLLQNNMDDDIDIQRIELKDHDGADISCGSLSIFCPFNNAEKYGYVAPSNSQIIRSADKFWSPTRVCKVLFKGCTPTVIQGTKQEVNFNITFRGDSSSADHLSKGVLYANVGSFTADAIETPDPCDLASFDGSSRFVVQDNSGREIVQLDKNGMMLITGYVKESSADIPDSDDFKIQKNDGTDVAWISNPEGDINLIGTLNQNIDPVTPDNNKNEFIIQNSGGTAVALFDDTGNLYLKSCVKNIL